MTNFRLRVRVSRFGGTGVRPVLRVGLSFLGFRRLRAPPRGTTPTAWSSRLGPPREVLRGRERYRGEGESEVLVTGLGPWEMSCVRHTGERGVSDRYLTGGKLEVWELPPSPQRFSCREDRPRFLGYVVPTGGVALRTLSSTPLDPVSALVMSNETVSKDLGLVGLVKDSWDL